MLEKLWLYATQWPCNAYYEIWSKVCKILTAVGLKWIKVPIKGLWTNIISHMNEAGVLTTQSETSWWNSFFHQKKVFFIRVRAKKRKFNCKLFLYLTNKQNPAHICALSLWAYHVFSHIKHEWEEPLCVCVFVYIESHKIFEDEMCLLWSQWLTTNLNLSILTCKHLETETPNFSELTGKA